MSVFVSDVKIHRRLLPLYEALQRAGYRVEPYRALNTSREGYIAQFGVLSCDVYMPLGTHVWIGEENDLGRDVGVYRVSIRHRRCVVFPNWTAIAVKDGKSEVVFVFKGEAAVPRCLALMGDLADAELALLKPAARRVSVLLGLMRRRDLSKPNGQRLSKDVRALVGRALMAAEMERAKEEVAGWR